MALRPSYPDRCTDQPSATPAARPHHARSEADKTAPPYDLRGSFASLLIQEGRNIVDVAKQLGHTPETCLRYYARLFDEAPEHPVPAEEAIRAARRQFAQERLAV